VFLERQGRAKASWTALKRIIFKSAVYRHRPHSVAGLRKGGGRVVILHAIILDYSGESDGSLSAI
jgi:hypothetical protein